jgi:hypothetical protein
MAACIAIPAGFGRPAPQAKDVLADFNDMESIHLVSKMKEKHFLLSS